MCDFNTMERVNLAELAKSLRICGDWRQQTRIAGSDACEGCKYRIDGDCKSFKGDTELLLNEAADAIEQLTADVRPVVRAKWEDVHIDRPEIADLEVASMFCPNCNRWHNRVYQYGNPIEFENFCSFCGADMREPPKEETE